VQVTERRLQVRQVDAQVPATAVWNFPSGARGRLSLRLRPNAGFQHGSVSLTDHFSIAGDAKAADQAVLSLSLSEFLRKPDQVYDVSIAWTGNGAEVSVDGEKKLDLKSRRAAANGLNYLRLSAGDAAGFQVESVRVKVAE
jgi:hypothetical protein